MDSQQVVLVEDDDEFDRTNTEVTLPAHRELATIALDGPGVVG